MSSLKKPVLTHRFESVKNKTTKEIVLSTEAIYSGTMGRIKRNIKKHIAFLEKQKASESFKLKSRIKIEDADSVDQNTLVEEDEKQADDKRNRISINIDQLKESLKLNKSVQKRQNELINSIINKK